MYWNQAAQATQFEAILAAAHWSKILTQKFLLFDQLLNPPPPKSLEIPQTLCVVGMTTYYGIKFKNSNSV